VQAVDVRKAEVVDAAVAEIWAEHGPLSGLVNNRGREFHRADRNDSPARSRR